MSYEPYYEQLFVQFEDGSLTNKDWFSIHIPQTDWLFQLKCWGISSNETRMLKMIGPQFEAQELESRENYH